MLLVLLCLPIVHNPADRREMSQKKICICLFAWKVFITIFILSGFTPLVYGNSTLFPLMTEESQNPAPARVLACGSRLKLEIKSICTTHRNSQPQGQAYYSPGFPEILKPRRNEGSLLRKIVNRVPRGVIEECCRKPCDRQSLLKYCSTIEKSPVIEPASSQLLQSTESSEQLESNAGQVKNESIILPLLLQLLWDWESWDKPYSPNILNYHPQKLLKIVKNRSHKQNCSRSRIISARDIDQNRLTQINSNSNIFPRSRHFLSSDETQRDSQVSDEIPGKVVLPYHHNSPLETLAVTVTDEPMSQVFAIPAGTNVDDYTG